MRSFVKILSRFLRLISNFVKDITSHLDSLVVLYTRADNRAALRRILATLAKENQHDPKLAIFIKYLVNRLEAHSSNLFVHPLAGESRKGVFEIIQQSQPLRASESAFDILLAFSERIQLVSYYHSEVCC